MSIFVSSLLAIIFSTICLMLLIKSDGKRHRQDNTGLSIPPRLRKAVSWLCLLPAMVLLWFGFYTSVFIWFMKTLIGGAIAAVLGLIGIAVWFDALLQLLAGTVPALLLLGGALALYLGFDELKESWKNDEGVEEEKPAEND